MCWLLMGHLSPRRGSSGASLASPVVGVPPACSGERRKPSGQSGLCDGFSPLQPLRIDLFSFQGWAIISAWPDHTAAGCRDSRYQPCVLHASAHPLLQAAFTAQKQTPPSSIRVYCMDTERGKSKYLQCKPPERNTTIYSITHVL